MESKESLFLPSCLTLPKNAGPWEHCFPCGVLRSARAVHVVHPIHPAHPVHPVLRSRSHRCRQLVAGIEPSPWAATAQYPPKHLALTLRRYRGLFQQGSSSVLIQPCIANPLPENKKPSCFFCPRM